MPYDIVGTGFQINKKSMSQTAEYLDNGGLANGLHNSFIQNSSLYQTTI